MNDDSLRDKINNTKIANVHNYIENAVRQDFLLCVSKLWERSEDAKSLITLNNNTDWNAVEDEIKQSSSSEIRADAKADFQNGCKEFDESELRKRLLVARAEGFAHSLSSCRERSKMEDPKGASIRDIEEALETGAKMWRLANLAIEGRDVCLTYLDSQFFELSSTYFKQIPFNRNRY